MKYAMELSKFEDLKHWRIACDCSDPKCDIELWIDCNDAVPQLNLQVDTAADAYIHKYWEGWKYYPKEIWWRIKTALRVLFVGRIETTSEFVLNLRNMEAFSEIITEVKDYYKGTYWEKQWQASSNTNISSSEQK